MRKFFLINGMFMLGMFLASLLFEEEKDVSIKKPSEPDMANAVDCLIDPLNPNINCSNNPLEFINLLEDLK
jgi:hypothetical protein